MTAPAPAPSGGSADALAPRPRPTSLLQLFAVFSGLALRGFGGVLPWAQRALVDERRWLSREEFVEVLAFGQVLPGPNICNVAVMLGDRWFGWRGAVTALAGMLAAPAVLVMTLALLYARFGDLPVVGRALAGMGAVAGGMMFGTAWKLAATQRRRWRWLGFGVLAFAAVALLRIKLHWVVFALAPVAVGVAWLAVRREAARGGGR